MGARLLMPVFFNDNNHEGASLDTLLLSPVVSPDEAIAQHETFAEPLLTEFDPNNITYNELLQFGIDARVARNWIRYLERGGRFRQPDELLKIYGLTNEVFQNLQPYIHFPNPDLGGNEHPIGNLPDDTRVNLKNILNFASELPGWDNAMFDTLEYWIGSTSFTRSYTIYRLRQWNMDSLQLIISREIDRQKTAGREIYQFDVNLADTSLWIALNGIGPVLSSRIVAYREALGGFATIQQVGEVHGISPELFKEIEKYLVIRDSTLRAINVNRASVRRLRDHPYLNFYQAKAIIEARLKRGAFKHVDEIKEVAAICERDWSRIAPYLKVGE